MHLSHLPSFLAIAIYTLGSPLSQRSTQPYLPKRLITLEDHAVSPSLEAEAIATNVNITYPGILNKLNDVGTGRLADMDTGHISLMVLSQSAPLGREDPSGCTAANNAIYDAIVANPTRFAGFAVLPLATPDQAATELDRSVTELGFKGAMIWNHLADGTYFDEDNGRFDPIFQKAVELDVPLYLHPAPPTAEVAADLFVGDYVQPQSTGRLSTLSWGWHVDVGTHILRLYSAGIFDKFPTLKIIIGHNGEDLPMFIDRIDNTGLRNDTTFASVWEKNIWTTTSGFFTVRAFQQLRQVMPIERIMYSVDYPFSGVLEGWHFIEQLAEEKVLTDQEMDMFAYKNAEALLGL